MSRFPSPSRAPRRGQALLLAVLIMIFAALLSASFLVVVSVNLNQTARQTDKNRAAASAKSGLDYVNNRLTYSPEGDKWFTNQYPAAALQNLVTMGNYYSPLDQAQGWAGSYAKFPDPRQITQGDGPQFLAKVERVDGNLPATDPDRSKPDLFGATRITVIGLSSDDPTAYHRTVAYKGGYQRAPIGRVMRTVSNWDFKNNQVPVAQVLLFTPTDTSVTPAAPTITFQSANDSFLNMSKPFASAPAQPFTITISNPRANVAARSVVVRDIVLSAAATATAPPTYKMTLASAVPAVAPTTGERIEWAANLGAPTGIDYDNDPSTAATAFTPVLQFRVSDGTVSPTTNQLDSARVNGGLVWSGQLLAEKLRAVGTAATVTGSIQTSGVIALDNTATASSVSIKSTDNTITDTLQASRDSQAMAGGGIFTGGESAAKYQLVDDAWNRLKGVPSGNNGSRAVTEFRPPNIASGEGLERYRSVARFSKGVGNLSGTIPAQTNGGLYGFGEDVYIDNPQDKEKFYSTAAPVGLREMTQAELIQMWLSKAPTLPALPADFTRTGVPLAPTVANASLEQQHLRGWVGPDEFRPRSVTITLNGNTTPPSITITRDARNDSPAANLGAAPTKAWKDPATGNAMPGVYRQVLPWPVHGVIFAEGNVSISGTVASAPRSLTVVSMNNIYIDNSLNAAPYKILLMAKRNVVMNPTRVMGRPDEQTISTGGATAVTTGTPIMLTVADSSSFNVGDFIQTSTLSTATPGTEVISTQGYVTAAPSSPFQQISFTPTTSGTINNGDLVRTPSPIMQSVPSMVASRNIAFTPVASSIDAFQRNIALPNPLPANVQLANLRLAFNHQAERIGAFTVDTTGTRPNPILFSNKGVFTAPPATAAPFLNPNATVASQAEKQIRVDFRDPGTGGSDLFPGTVATNASAPTYPTNNTEANDTTRNVSAISAAMNATGHPDNIAGTDWGYTTAPIAGYGNLPFYYLAGVGNRSDFKPAVALAELRKDIGQALATPYQVPLSTSISLFLNGTPTVAVNEVWNATYTTPAYEQTKQFGFSPSFEDGGIPSEDVLTSDQSFYQSTTDAQNSTIDSRQIPGLTAATLGFNANPFSLRQSVNLPALAAPAKYPDYRVMGLKLENVALAANASTITNIDTAYTFDVNAYVYAQTGSWFVIPGPMFDERLRGTETKTFLDLNSNGIPETGEFLDAGTVGIWDDGDFADLNRNNIVDDAERRAMTRYSRFNYQINFTGAIAENQTALINDVGTGTNQVLGAVSDWMNKWATTKFDGTTFANGRMQYFFDPTVATGALDDDPSTPGVIDPDPGFHLPQTTELFYQD